MIFPVIFIKLNFSKTFYITNKKNNNMIISSTKKIYFYVLCFHCHFFRFFVSTIFDYDCIKSQKEKYDSEAYFSSCWLCTKLCLQFKFFLCFWLYDLRLILFISMLRNVSCVLGAEISNFMGNIYSEISRSCFLRNRSQRGGVIFQI